MTSRTRSWKPWVLAFVALAAGNGASVLRAQDPIKLVSVDVRNPRGQPFRVGQKLMLSVNPQDLPRAGTLRLRVLRGSKTHLLALADGAGDDCITISGTLWAVGRDGILLSADLHFRPDWVRYVDGQAADEEYLLLFEDKSSEAGLDLRLRGGDWRTLVERGFPIVVSGAGLRRPAVRPSRNPRRVTASQGSTGSAPAPPVVAPCRRVQFVGTDGSMQLAVASCAPGSTPLPGAELPDGAG